MLCFRFCPIFRLHWRQNWQFHTKIRKQIEIFGVNLYDFFTGRETASGINWVFFLFNDKICNVVAIILKLLMSFNFLGVLWMNKLFSCDTAKFAINWSHRSENKIDKNRKKNVENEKNEENDWMRGCLVTNRIDKRKTAVRFVDSDNYHFWVNISMNWLKLKIMYSIHTLYSLEYYTYSAYNMFV